MNSYGISFSNYNRIEVAETAGKAKYKAYLYYNDVWPDLTFRSFIVMFKCKTIGKFKPSDIFGDTDDFNRIKHYRNIDFAFQGMKVEVDGRTGTIVGGNSSMNLCVVFDGGCEVQNCHPWWRIKYFDSKGTVVAEFKS